MDMELFGYISIYIIIALFIVAWSRKRRLKDQQSKCAELDALCKKQSTEISLLKSNEQKLSDDYEYKIIQERKKYEELIEQLERDARAAIDKAYSDCDAISDRAINSALDKATESHKKDIDNLETRYNAVIDSYKQVTLSLQKTIGIHEAKEVVYENELTRLEIELSRANTPETSEDIQKLQAKIDRLLQENASLNATLNQYRSKEERNIENTLRGHAYEIQIGELLGKGAVSVYYRGIFRGKKDNGIDLIITTDKEILLIQCKNYSTPGTLHHASVSSFCMSVDRYKAPQNLIVRPILVCTDAVSFDWEANAQLRARNIEIRRISFDESYMNNLEQNVQHIKENNGTLVSADMSGDDECDQDYDPEYFSDDYDDDYDHIDMKEELSTEEDDPYGYYLYYGINSPDDFDISNDTPDDFPDDYLQNMTIHASMDDYFEYEGTRPRFYFDDDNDDPDQPSEST